MQPDSLDRVGTELYDMPPRPYEDFYIGLLNIMTSDRFEEVSLSRDWPQIKYFGRMGYAIGLQLQRPVLVPYGARAFYWGA